MVGLAVANVVKTGWILRCSIAVSYDYLKFIFVATLNGLRWNFCTDVVDIGGKREASSQLSKPEPAETKYGSSAHIPNA